VLVKIDILLAEMSMNDNTERFTFSNLVKKVMQDRKVTMQKLAAMLDMKYDALSSRFRSNGSPFSPDEVRNIIRALPDVRLVNYILSGTDYIGAERADDDEDPVHALRDLRETAIRMSIEAADANHAILRALEDGKICHNDFFLLEQELETAEGAVVTVKQHVRMLIDKPSGC
jgi:hypothetical protein